MGLKFFYKQEAVSGHVRQAEDTREGPRGVLVGNRILLQYTTHFLSEHDRN